MPIRVGCSGWSYEDWIGRFYPVALAKKKEEWLRYYASYFNTVEISSTLYRPPSEMVVSGWIKKGLTLKDFEYSVHMPRSVTHDALLNGKGEMAGISATAFEEICVKPLAHNHLLGAVLIQMSPDFKNEGTAQKDLRALLNALDCDKYHYAVEFHHPSWLEGTSDHLDPSASELLRQLNVAAVQVDTPGMPAISDITADHSYLRFYGRNTDAWSAEEREDELRADRFDYLYSEEELRRWEERIKALPGPERPVRAYFKNHGRAKGVKNAFQLMDLLNLPHREKEIAVQEQTAVGSFMMYHQ